MRVISRAIATLVLLSVLSSFARADDLFPPTWRGQPGTTFAQWEYLTPNPSPAPDITFNPWGIAATRVYPGVGQNWMSQFDGRDGVWPLSGEIWVDVPNRPVTSPYKDIQVQLTWSAQAPGNVPTVLTTLPQTVPGTLVQTTPLGGSWMHSVYTMHLEPNPDWEQILITGGINVDELVIDTICIPEPSSLMLLGLAATLMLRRRG